jgi:hypothetical protein
MHAVLLPCGVGQWQSVEWKTAVSKVQKPFGTAFPSLELAGESRRILPSTILLALNCKESR